MNATMLSSALALALAHSVWQAAAVALALEATLAALPSGLGWGSARHRAAAAALALCLLLLPATVLWLLASPPAAAAAAGPALHGAGSASTKAAQAGTTLGSAATLLGSLLPWLLALWGTAVAVSLLRLQRGVRQLRRLVRAAGPAPAAVAERCGALATRLGMRRRPLVLLAEVTSPAAVGGRRPAILLSAQSLAALGEDELDGVLLHELAHLARYDDVLALLQALAEALLVLSPAVRLVSRRLREEREHRSDDVVASISGRARYARLLAHLDELRQPPTLTRAALAATGTPLLRRIRRIALPGRGRPWVALPRAAALALVLAGGSQLLAASARALPRGTLMVIRAHDDAGPFTVSLLDGHVVGASVDGRDVPAPRLRVVGDSLHVLDGRGAPELSLRLLPGGLSWHNRRPRS
ncbi:MAG TPA: M56 family metallopeptidase [Longimicrobiales bacterium]